MMDKHQEKPHLESLLREYDFIKKEIGDSQTARLNILGFTVAGVGAILGVTADRLVEPKTPPDYFIWALICFSLGLLITAQILTIAYSQGIIRAGAYIREFIEPHVPGLQWETRLYQVRKHRRFRLNLSNTSNTLGLYYCFLAVATTTMSFIADIYRFPFLFGPILFLSLISVLASFNLITHKTRGWNTNWTTDDKNQSSNEDVKKQGNGVA